MPKYAVYVTYKETGYIEVEAENEEQAIELADQANNEGRLSSYGDEDVDYEVEDITE